MGPRLTPGPAQGNRFRWLFPTSESKSSKDRQASLHRRPLLSFLAIYHHQGLTTHPNRSTMSATRCSRPVLGQAGPSTCRRCRTFVSASRLFPQPPPDPHRRLASTQSSQTDWLGWIKKPGFLDRSTGTGKALLFAGLVSHALYVRVTRADV